MFNSFRAGINFRRQNLTSKVVPRAERVIGGSHSPSRIRAIRPIHITKYNVSKDNPRRRPASVHCSKSRKAVTAYLKSKQLLPFGFARQCTWMYSGTPTIAIKPFNRQIIQLEFSPTWSCVSLTRPTTSSEWKLFRFDKMEVNSFQIVPIDITLWL